MKARKITVETDTDWIAKDVAARLLGVSVRQVENRAARGEIEKRTLPKAPSHRAARVEYSRRDVDRILAGIARPKPVAHQVSQSSAVSSFAPSNEVRKQAVSAETNIAAFAQALAAALPVPGKPWLSLSEAADYTGLPARWLREAAREGRLRAQNVGVKRERWMFPREGLS